MVRVRKDLPFTPWYPWAIDMQSSAYHHPALREEEDKQRPVLQCLLAGMPSSMTGCPSRIHQSHGPSASSNHMVQVYGRQMGEKQE